MHTFETKDYSEIAKVLGALPLGSVSELRFTTPFIFGMEDVLSIEEAMKDDNQADFDTSDFFLKITDQQPGKIVVYKDSLKNIKTFIELYEKMLKSFGENSFLYLMTVNVLMKQLPSETQAALNVDKLDTQSVDSKLIERLSRIPESVAFALIKLIDPPDTIEQVM